MTRRIKLEGTNKLRLETARTRLVVGGILFAAGFLVIAGRLVELGVVRHLAAPDPTPIAAAEPASPPQRADIVDRNGVLLATNLTTASLFAVPRRIRDPDKTVRRLTAILPDLDAAETAERLRSTRGFVWLKRNLTPRQQFEVNRLGVLGLDFVREQRRIYPHGVLTAHVVGFTGIDNDGLAGVEKSLDAELRDAPAPLHLSLDIRVQQILREALADQIARFDAIGGGGIVLDANTGAVVALVSLPDFDANRAGAAADDARFNRVTLGVYELGSIFKVFNHALALESGIVDLDSGYDATEPLRVAGFTISDFHGEKRWLTVPEIFIHSSNIGSAKMAADIGGPAQRAFLTELGMLARTGIELAERGQPIGPAPWRGHQHDDHRLRPWPRGDAIARCGRRRRHRQWRPPADADAARAADTARRRPHHLAADVGDHARADAARRRRGHRRSGRRAGLPGRRQDRHGGEAGRRPLSA